MKKQNKNDNAANRKSYVGYLYNIGEKNYKNSVLNSFEEKWNTLHNQGYIHIHDLEAYGLTYNCLTFEIMKSFPFKEFENMEKESIIVGVFDFIKELFEKIGNEQSGGMSFANFDIEFAYIFTKLNIDFKNYKNIFKASINSLISWANNIHTRMGQTSYYVSFNVGLGISEFERFITFTLIDEFYKKNDLFFKPNIIFKVSKGINLSNNDPNFDLLEKSLLCSAKKMIPTYLLCDSESNKLIDAKELSIVGCRTRVVDNLFGNSGSIGRGNIANISINLPKLAFEVNEKHSDFPMIEKIEKFKLRWKEIAEISKDILIDRFHKTCQGDVELFPTNLEYQLWIKNIRKGLYETWKNGTLSIGFIGLTEAMEILTKTKFWKNKKVYEYAIEIVEYMRNYCNDLIKKYNLNFSLLATSGELISGRFLEIDRKKYTSDILSKNYYTNSFHVDVDSKLPAYRKLELEGKFHKYANGGSISYIELTEAPLGNSEGLKELVEIAIKSGVNYLGFNFPKDICELCNTSGVFDICPNCKNDKITRIRRVSGYLEIENYFTSGKKNESSNRKGN